MGVDRLEVVIRFDEGNLESAWRLWLVLKPVVVHSCILGVVDERIVVCCIELLCGLWIPAALEVQKTEIVRRNILNII